jgi:hypothetical protein
MDDLTRIRIDRAEIWTLVDVAVETGQREILKVIRSAMLARHDVLDVKLSEWC